MRIAAAAFIVVLTGAVLAAVPAGPASGPASASRPVPAPLMADLPLRSFPGSANSLGGRSDARNLRLEGRVREIHSATLPAGGSETRVVLVGSGQPDESAAHFTCHIDMLPNDVKIDKIIRITGAVGPIVAAGDRVELSNCRDVMVVGDPTVGNRLAGMWRCNAVVLDGVALRKEAQQQGKKIDEIPATDFASKMHMELAIKTDGTFAAELRDGETLIRKTAGHWVVTKDGDDTAKVRLEVPGAPVAEPAVTFAGDRLKIALPGYADKHLTADNAFEKLSGVVQPMDWKGMKNQTLGWFTANTSLPQQNAQEVVNTMSGELDAYFTRHNWYVSSLGAGVVKRGKTTVFLAAFNKVTALEFSDAQTQHDASHKGSSNIGEIPAGGPLMTPEVKVESLVFDKKGPIDPAQPLSGKITMRGLRRAVPGQYALLLEMQGSLVIHRFDRPVGADSETFGFQFDPIGPRLQPTMGATIPLIFVVARQSATPTVQGDACLISEPLINLVDIAGR